MEIRGKGRPGSILCLGVVLSTAAWRSLAADFTVLNTNDSGAGSLRQAILDANATPGHDRILFSIPGAVVHHIVPDTELPALADSAGVTIDGYSQPGSAPNTAAVGTNALLLIEIQVLYGQLVYNGLVSASDNNVIRGLAINGGVSPLYLSGRNLRISGNFVGTDAVGLQGVPNVSTGIALFGCMDCVIGGTDLADRNLISGNLPGGGIQFHGTTGTVVEGNVIGLNATGLAALPNFNGIEVDDFSSDNLIGGTEAGSANYISGNDGEGVLLGGGASDGNRLEGNFIGLAADGATPLPNTYGVFTSSRNTVGGSPAAANRIAHSRREGVIIGVIPTDTSRGATVLWNLIYGNGGLAIDLAFDGLTANDQGDIDVGPNSFQNCPELLHAVTSPVTGRLYLTGSQDSNQASGPNHLQFFLAEGPGHGGSTATLLDVPGLPTGAFPFQEGPVTPPVAVNAGAWVTATATTGDGTSEFAGNIPVVTNQPPIGSSGPNQSATVGQDVTLDGSPSIDPDALPTGSAIADGRFSWVQISGPPSTLTANVTGHPSFTPILPGTYVFELTVSDGLDLSTNTATATVTVNAGPAVATIPMTGPTGSAVLAIALAFVGAVLIRTRGSDVIF